MEHLGAIEQLEQKRPSYSPWGQIDHIERYAEGIFQVSTPGHGGLMIRKSVGNKLLSLPARKRAIDYRGWYAYEEDCDWAIAGFELWDQGIRLPRTTREDMIKTLSSWNADYLEEIGVKPDPESYKFYQKRKEDEERRKRNDPDLIVAAWGDWYTKKPKVTQVVTASDDYYWVDEKAYDELRESGGLNLLSRIPKNKILKSFGKTDPMEKASKHLE